MSADLPNWIAEEEDLVARGVPALIALQDNTMPLDQPNLVRYGIISPYHALGLGGN